MSDMQWRAVLSDGTRKLVPGHSFSDGLRAAQVIDPSVDDVDQADGCSGQCYCGEVDYAGYTYNDEHGDCNHCTQACDCLWLRKEI